MNEQQRSQVRDNARYLREVRPIDPEEIYEYVDGQPHPAAVRQVLREEAPSLGLLERADGTFEPVDEAPLAVDFAGVDAIPDSIVRNVEALLVERFGPDWADGDTGAQLREAIRDFKRRYLHGATVTYDEVTALGYAIYHLPTYFAATQYVLADLAADGLMPMHCRVLDVGAGVGGPALGLAALVPEGALVDYHAVEPSPAADVLESLLDDTGRNFHPTVHRTRIESFEAEGSFDVVLFANVLSELDDPVSVVSAALDDLAADGSVVCLAPADRNTATALRTVEREVESATDATVYAPTIRLWPHERPSSDSWSFDRKADLAVPRFQRRLDEGERADREALAGDDAGEEDDAGDQDEPADAPADERMGGGKDEASRKPGDGEFLNVDVQYAYSMLRLDGRRAIDYRASQAHVSKMAETERHVTDRIDYVAIKLSHDLSTGGNPLYLLGDGSQQIDHFAVLTDEGSLTRDLTTADYGDLVRLENVLVLWNDDEGAYNLVVDDEAFVERIGP